MVSHRCLACGVLAFLSSLMQLVVFTSLYGVAKLNVPFLRSAYPSLTFSGSATVPAAAPKTPPGNAPVKEKFQNDSLADKFSVIIHRKGLDCPSAQFYGGYKNGKGGKLPDGEGGYMVCDPAGIQEAATSSDGCLVYSIGSDGEFSFERAVHGQISEKCEIHTFDAYPIEKYLDKNYNPGYPHDPVPAFVTYHTATLDASRSLQDMMAQANHRGRKITLLKISCNGCEMGSHNRWLDDGVDIDQIVVKQANPKIDISKFFTDRGYGCFAGGDETSLLGLIKQPLRSSALLKATTSHEAKADKKRIPPASQSSVCMLIPVYPPHFPAMAARMQMVGRTNIGPPVKSVVVFGADSEYTDFCQKYPAVCQDDTFHPMSLEEMLGVESHARLKRILEMDRPALKFRYKGERYGCWSKTNGRVYQTVKKFYGAAFGPPECQTYWVSDAESLPFRKHNLAAHLALNAKTPRIVLSGWHDEPPCDKVLADDGTDQSCAVMMTQKTNGMRFWNDTTPSVWTAYRWKKIFQNVDQWWYYDRSITADWLQFLADSAGVPAWAVFAFYELSDMSMYGMMMHWSAFYAHPGKAKIVNIRAEIRKVDAGVFARCCSCATHSGRGTPPACSTIPDLFAGCLTAIPFEKRLALAVDTLGFFGFSNYNRFTVVPDNAYNELTADGHGLHWCFINCFKGNAMDKILRLKDVDEEGVRMFKHTFLNTNV